MTRELEFENYLDKWYVVLPEWEGDKEELEMVLGADKFLDKLSNFGEYVRLTVSNEFQENWQYLEHDLFNIPEIGANYKASTGEEMWLCPVAKFVFGEYPEKIYFKQYKTFL